MSISFDSLGGFWFYAKCEEKFMYKHVGRAAWHFGLNGERDVMK